jgi:hypothetical protein
MLRIRWFYVWLGEASGYLCTATQKTTMYALRKHNFAYCSHLISSNIFAVSDDRFFTLSYIQQIDHYILGAGFAPTFRWEVLTQMGLLKKDNPNHWTLKLNEIRPCK